MSPNPLDTLKKGLVNLQSQAGEAKSRLLTRLANHREERALAWPNLIEKEQVIEELEKASDYEQGLGMFNEIKRKVVVCFFATTGNIVVSNKQKSRFLNEFCEDLLKA